MELEGRAAACLIGHALPDEVEPVPADMPPMFVPLQKLENLAPGTWYVNVLAAYPGQRGKGCGTALLGLADRIAAGQRQTGAEHDRCADVGARRLYERCGYGEVASGNGEGWQHPGRDWVLLVKGADA